MTNTTKLRRVAVCGACVDVPVDPDAVRMVRKDPAERNRAKARRRAKRGKS